MSVVEVREGTVETPASRDSWNVDRVWIVTADPERGHLNACRPSVAETWTGTHWEWREHRHDWAGTGKPVTVCAATNSNDPAVHAALTAEVTTGLAALNDNEKGMNP